MFTSSLILKAPKESEIRAKHQQIPSNTVLLEKIIDYFKNDYFKFEKFASELVISMDNHFLFETTRSTKDGGHNAIGTYNIGLSSTNNVLPCFLEVKCYSLNNSVGVKETPRLIFRMENGDFSISVTTSFIAKQACKKIIEDRHKVIIISGIDI
ncbi:restriction endonuclease [Marinilactibacillus psychrotolerans]|uniref:restriction endonuclease n=1 Tax=Marinilactibacillus psychrotolerans TaxID=191770 RepID=UPI00388991FA